MKRDENKSRETLTVYLSPESCAAVQELAKARKIPVSRLIRQSLTKYLKVSCLLIGLLGGCVHQEEEIAPAPTPSQEPAPTPTQEPTPEPTAWPDKDGDGYTADKDCDDSEYTNSPGWLESCDYRDNDCDGLVDEGVTNYYYWDSDTDHWPVQEYSWTSCEPCDPMASPNIICSMAPWDQAWDCNDNNYYIHPGSDNPNYDCVPA